MRKNTDELITQLTQDATPVTPLWPPYMRAGAFLAAVIAVMGGVAVFAGHVDETLASFIDMPAAAAFAGAIITGVCAIVAAVMLSVPGRSDGWMVLPLPGALLWLTSSGVQCYQSVAASGWGDGGPFASMACFQFIALAGLPVSAGVYLLLRRAVAINLAAVTAYAGLGAAMLAAALLQFIHPHGANPVDLASHIAAIVSLMVVMLALGRRALRLA
ncbi:MAG: DUF1109 domain-containing protein [Alphaproteobacteria bacterium]|nr:DUF1109 domain-containing protein [Alphaproteobacteria bacterium]